MRATTFARIGLLALALLVCVANLGDAVYWQDEGLTAFLGKTTLEHGVPMAWDGRNLAHDINYTRLYNDDFVWVGHPWLPFYVSAAAFAIGGTSPGVGRLPFALCGWLSLVALYPAARAWFRSERVALWSLVVGVCSVSFYLYTRQCQYYALLMLGTVLLWWGLARAEDKRSGAWLIALGLSLLAWSNPVTLAGVVPACVIEIVRRARTRQQWGRYIAGGAAAAVLFLPYVLYARVWELYGDYQREKLPVLLRAILQGWRFLWETNAWVFPVAVLPLLVWSMRASKDDASPLAAWSADDARALRRLALETLLCFCVVSAVSPWPFFRYLMPLLPLSFLLLGAVLARTFVWKPWAGGVLAISLLATRAWSVAGHAATAAIADRVAETGVVRGGLRRLEPNALRLRTQHLDFAYELTHDYTGPVDALVAFFRDRARAGDTAAITYPTEPFAVLTPLNLVARIPPAWPEAQTLPPYVSQLGTPDWIVVRAHYPNNLIDLDAFMAMHGADYRRHELPVSDVTWNNRPDPGVHYFRSPTGDTNLVVYERIRDAAITPTRP